MIVDNYSFDGNKLSLELTGKEDLIGSYFIDDYQELLNLKESIKYGVEVKLFGKLNEVSNNTIPNTFSYKDYLEHNDIYYTLSIDKIEIVSYSNNFIYKIRNIVNDRIQNVDDKGYLKAFILGDSEEIDKEIYKVYQNIGVTHLFALSGSQVCLISVFLFKVLKRIKEYKKYIIVNLFVIVYGFIVSFPASIKRCIVFFILNSINKVLKLELSSIRILILVFFFLIIYNYKIIYDVGFLYSIITVAGIIISNNYINHDNKLISGLRLAFVAFLFSMPISLLNFYQVNILSIFYNVIYVPIVGGFIYFLSLFTFLLPFMYKFFFIIIIFLENVSIFLADINFGNIYLNFNLFEVIFFYLILFVMFYKNNFKFLIILFFVVFLDIIIPYFDNSFYAYFFDVGQGDSCLIITPYRKEVILLDTGGVSSFYKEEWMERSSYYVSDNILSFLKSIGVKSIDYLIITHGDYDHMGDALHLIDNFKVGKVILNNGKHNDLELELIKVLDKKKISYYQNIKELNIGDSKLYFLNNKVYDNENDNSIVLYTKISNHKLLLMGDAGVEVEQYLIDEYNLKDVDVLKVGHHGSRTSTSDEYIDYINPEYAIISVGKNNRYGHPNNEVLEILDKSNIYRTDQEGSIIFKFKKNILEVSTFPP